MSRIQHNHRHPYPKKYQKTHDQQFKKISLHVNSTKLFSYYNLQKKTKTFFFKKKTISSTRHEKHSNKRLENSLANKKSKQYNVQKVTKKKGEKIDTRH